MKRTIQFSKGFRPAVIFSALLMASAVVGLFVRGFNMGVDFAAGLNETVRIADPALSISWTGTGNAEFRVQKGAAQLVLSKTLNDRTIDYPFAQYPTLDDLAKALSSIDGISARVVEGASGGMASALLIPTETGNRALGPTPTLAHRQLEPGQASYATIEKVRAALGNLGLGGQVGVQNVGAPSQQSFMIRVEYKAAEKAVASKAGDAASPSASAAPAAEGETTAVDAEGEFTRMITAKVEDALGREFGEEKVIVISSDLMGSRFSKDLGRSAIWLVALALAAIMVYATIRFKMQFAIGAVLAIIHDALVMVAFMIWTRMEFNTSSIAAILTILGYSINDTIVIFDRIRENTGLRKDEPFTQLLDESLTETLSRTIITTVTTLVAVVSLFIFTRGTMRDFALALIVGIVSGTYSTVFIASAFVDFWQKRADKRTSKKEGHLVGTAKAAKPAKA